MIIRYKRKEFNIMQYLGLFFTFMFPGILVGMALSFGGRKKGE